jgi:hypothetical protein
MGADTCDVMGADTCVQVQIRVRVLLLYVFSCRRSLAFENNELVRSLGVLMSRKPLTRSSRRDIPIISSLLLHHHGLDYYETRCSSYCIGSSCQ